VWRELTGRERAKTEGKQAAVTITGDKFYITTAIDYANNVPHLGTAYEKVCADVIARYMRLRGRNTFFSMGNDEHSQNVYKGAGNKGLSPQDFTDHMADIFQETWAGIEISYDRFVRTTEQQHTRAVEEVFRRINARGDVYNSKYSGWYCVSCEGFLKEEELIDGKCPTHKIEPKWIEEENLFFALSKYAGRVLEHIEANPGFVQPEARRNEVVSFIKGGVSDVSISRAGVEWGIPVPTQRDHVFYVWFDALINYLTAVGFPDDMERFSRYWPADLHIIGKDITRFHCILWPAMLMSAGIELPLAIHGHGFVNLRGERMSKTLGNIVDPLELAEKYGPDSLRYYLTREVVFGKDGDFSWEQFIQRYNSELANDLGNLVSRTCGMLTQYFGGRIPGEPECSGSRDSAMRSVCEAAWKAYSEVMDRYEIHGGIAEVFKVVRAANRHIEENAPWALMKKASGKPEAARVLFTVSEALRSTAVLLFPFMPRKAGEIWRILGIDTDISRVDFEQALTWKDSWEGISSELGQLRPLFPRIEAEAEAGGGERLGEKPQTEPEKEDGELLDISEFKKLDLRIAHIKSATLVPGAKKLLKMSVDIGDGERQIVAGIAEHYAPEDLVGKNIVVVANLKPAKIRGVESQGMLLAASDGDNVILLVPDKEAAPGSPIS
jgi:methionyl-tRNA synthetase